jgi:hypothetical protein
MASQLVEKGARTETPFSLLLPPEDREWIAEVAAREDRSAASVVRRLISEARQQEQTTAPDSSGVSSSP